jgi:hypothetical protein
LPRAPVKPHPAAGQFGAGAKQKARQAGLFD